jgi:glycine betaine/choline ABC-type transport system substrate-binding protein
MRVLAIGLTLGLLLSGAPAQAQQVRLAGPADCLERVACGAGLRSAYGLDASSAFVPLTVAESGISAIDDGVAEVAVTSSSDPGLARPEIVSLSDDRRMLYADHVVPVVRRGVLRVYGTRAIRRRLDAASAALTTSGLRALNQAVVDGRLPEAVGGELAQANGLTRSERRRRGPRIDVGFMDTAENELLAHFYAESLRGGGYRVAVRSVRGSRPEAVALLRRDRIDVYADHDGSLLRYLVGTAPERLAAGLQRTLARIAAVPMRRSRAEHRTVFVTRADTAARLGLARVSDLSRYWPATT